MPSSCMTEAEVLYTEGSIDHFSAKDENGDAGDLILYLPPVKPHTLVPVIGIDSGINLVAEPLLPMLIIV